jgi:hypothetical protein
VVPPIQIYHVKYLAQPLVWPSRFHEPPVVTLWKVRTGSLFSRLRRHADVLCLQPLIYKAQGLGYRGGHESRVLDSAPELTKQQGNQKSKTPPRPLHVTSRRSQCFTKLSSQQELSGLGMTAWRTDLQYSPVVPSVSNHLIRRAYHLPVFIVIERVGLAVNGFSQ